MAKSIDEEIIKESIKQFILNNPNLLKAWIAESLNEKAEGKPLFPKFDKEKVIREHAITRASLKKAQQFFKDAPPAEVMIKLLDA
jgi:hypothetical protein